MKKEKKKNKKTKEKTKNSLLNSEVKTFSSISFSLNNFLVVVSTSLLVLKIVFTISLLSFDPISIGSPVSESAPRNIISVLSR